MKDLSILAGCRAQLIGSDSSVQPLSAATSSAAAGLLDHARAVVDYRGKPAGHWKIRHSPDTPGLFVPIRIAAQHRPAIFPQYLGRPSTWT